MVAAAVVVANPVTPPSRDMQISTTQLSTSPGMLTPFDKSLLNAIVPQFPPAGIGPALAQILAALAADADRISREVNSGAAAGDPITAAASELAGYRQPPAEAPPVESVGATPALEATGFASPISNPAVQAVVSGLVADTSYLGGKVVEAAYAAVDAIIRVPQVLITAVAALLQGNIAGALDTIESTVKDFIGSGLILLDAIRDVFLNHLPPLPVAAAAAVTTTDVGGAALAVGADQPAGSDPAPAADSGSSPAVPGGTGTGSSARKRTPAESLGALRATSSMPRSRAGGAAGQATTAAPSDPASPPAPPSPATTRATAGSARTATASGSQRNLRPGAKADSAAH